MKDIEIYVHTDRHHEPELITISEGATVEEVLIRIAPGEHAEVLLFVEGEEEPRERHHHFHDCHVHHRHHVHVHRRRQVEVRVSYNGAKHEHRFAPAKTVETVLRWALQAFGLKGHDAMNKVLRLAHGGAELPEAAHIGSFVKAEHHGVLDLHLTVRRNVNG